MAAMDTSDTSGLPYEYLFADSPPRDGGQSSAQPDGQSRKRKEPSSGFESESAEAMDDFLYYQFFNVDDEERGKSTNGWQREQEAANLTWKRRGPEAPVTSFTGRMALDNEAKLEAIGCKAANAFVLEGPQFRDMVFYGMKEPLLPYFFYEFQASKGDRRGAGNRDVYFVRPTTLMWRPLPMMPAIARHVFENHLPGAKNATLRMVMASKLANVNPSVPLDLPKLESLLIQHPLERIKLSSMGIVKRIFFHAELAPLYPYYNVKDVENLDVEAIKTLNRFVTAPSAQCNPIALCFVSAARNLGLRCRDFDRVWYLPELSHAQYMHVCATGKFVPPRVEALSVKLHDRLNMLVKQHGHKYVDDDTLGLYTDEPEKALFEDALRLLQGTYSAIAIEPLSGQMRAIYPYRIHMCERIILSGLRVVLARFIVEPPARKPADEVVDYPMRPTHPLCSEQKLSVAQSLERPFTAISGPAGAGKSAGLSEFLAHVGAIDWASQVVMATYQGNNAATAVDTNTPFAKTAHRILAKHANKCKKSPVNGRSNQKRKTTEGPERGRGRGRGGRGRGRDAQMTMSQFVDVLERADPDDEDEAFVDCPLENVRVLVIDEIGLFYEELFAPLLHVLTTCGKLSQIVVCGDHRQMVQIQPGQLQQDLLYGFADWTIKYEHQHRFDDEAAVIFRHNSMKIHAGLPGAVEFRDGIFERFEPKEFFYPPSKMKDLEGELVDLFRKIGFNDGERCMAVTRTHELKDLIMRALEIVQYGNIVPYALRVGQKVMSRRTNLKAEITAKQVLLLERIEDCELPRGRTIKSLEEYEYRFLTPGFTNARSTNDKKVHRMVRRLRCRVVNSTRIVYLPYDGQYAGRVMRAGAVTERTCQGTQADHIFILKPTFWKEADVKECCYVVCTRQRKRVSMFCRREVFNQWVRNPAPPRNSLLGSKVRELYNEFARVYTIPPPTPEILALREEEGDRYTAMELVPTVPVACRA